MHGNTLHRPLANDTAWNGTAFVILANEHDILHSGKNGVKQSYYNFKISLQSNTDPALDKLFLTGIRREKTSEKEEIQILNDIPYSSTASGFIKINIMQPKESLDDLYYNHTLLLKAHNKAGKSEFPLILKASNRDGIEDRMVLLAILLPCVLLVVAAAASICIYQSYR